MSGGRLVVVDRGGRDAKRYVLAEGLATLGSAPACDIRVMLPAVCAHHATVAVHPAQTVIRNVGKGETLVNGRSISVAALRHCDVITLGDRSLRWEYSAPSKRQLAGSGSPGLPALTAARGARGARRARGAARRGSAGAPPPARDRALQLAIEMSHRASMPASSGGKQVAIVQPQRRDNNEQAGTVLSGARRPKADAGATAEAEAGAEEEAAAEAGGDERPAHNAVPLNTTKATLWIESRKSSPRRAPRMRRTESSYGSAPRMRRTQSPHRSTPLRLAVLKKAQSAHKTRVVKIEAPLKIDHTKQAAIMLMTGHTPKSRLTLNQSKNTPSYVIKKPSPVRKFPAGKARAPGRSSRSAGATPRRASAYSHTRKSLRATGNHSVIEISDCTRVASRGNVATRSTRSPHKSPLLPSPKKSALKDLTKKGNRKTESIKFDLSNLESHQESEITSRFDSEDSLSEEELTLHYSESSNQSPSPRKPISSRSSRMLERLGTALPLSPSRTLTPNSPSSRKSARSSMILQKALDYTRCSDYSKSDQSANTVASAFRTRTLSPRSRNLESFSIVDLVSIDSDTSKSVYNSAASADSALYGTPNATRRNTRSTIDPTLLGSSTPYVARVRASRSQSGPDVSRRSTRSEAGARRSKSLSTPEDRPISVNSTKRSRARRSRSRINDSDLLLLDDTEPEDSSPKTSRRTRTKSTAKGDSKNSTATERDGTCTPENGRSPVEAGTPVLSIQSLLDSSHGSSLRSLNSTTKGRNSVNYKRKTIGVFSEPKRRPAGKSKSLGMSARQTILRLSKDSGAASDGSDPAAPLPDSEDTVTPKSALKPVPEAVKSKHSTAKKPQSKRAIIDDLDRSDIVKQLFNSPVKRKLSHSMTEFRRHLSDDEEVARRPARHTIAAGRADSVSERSGTFTPERFVSPISTPSHSPNLSGIKRLFQKNTPENDLTDVRGVRSLLRTHRTRRSARNDLTNVTGLTLMFANSPESRGESPSRAGPSPRDDLTDVRGVKKLFRRSPENDLTNVSGVKRALRRSPANDLTDVRGVRKMFKTNKRKQSSPDVSGVEELFDASAGSARNSDSLFDRLVGKPNIRNVYSKTFSTKLTQKPKNRRGKTLHRSLEVTTDNVEDWLERELQKRFRREEPSALRSRNTSRNFTKELQNLATFTVDGGEPIKASRTRNSSMIKKSASEIYGAHTLPIKKRSLVDTSIDTSKAKLPIKKRAVVHSTPVKGRVNITMNASELGRVSPITADKAPGDHNTSLLTRTRQNAPTPKNRASKVKTPQKEPVKLSPKPSTSKATSKVYVGVSKPSPKASPKKVAQSLPKRVTRNRKNTTSENIKKRRSSLVISKKAPSMSPKADPKTAQATPMKRVTRAKQETPKRTRVNQKKSTIVVPKPSPKLKPQAAGKASQLELNTRRTRKNAAVELPTESPKESQPRKTRAKQNELKGKENQTDNIEKPKRGRKAAAPTDPPTPKRGRAKRTAQETKTRSKSMTKPDSKTEEKQSKARGKKVEPETVESKPTVRRGRKNTENVSVEPKTRGKKTAEPVDPEPKTRSKKVETQSSVQSEPATRGRPRTKAVDNTGIPETKGRKRKTEAIEEVPSKLSKTQTRRGRRADLAPEQDTETVNTRAAADKSETGTEERKTRGRAHKVEKPEPAKTTRAKKVEETKESPAPHKRKRKTKVETSPTKGQVYAGTKPRAASKRARAAPPPPPPPPPPPTSAEESTRAVGRSRRR